MIDTHFVLKSCMRIGSKFIEKFDALCLNSGVLILTEPRVHIFCRLQSVSNQNHGKSVKMLQIRESESWSKGKWLQIF